MEKTENEKLAIHVSVVTIIVNFLLTAFKLFAGFFSHSSAMVSDAIHSASDVLSTVVVIIGVKIANKQSDTDHPYGHERFESVAAIILAMMLAVTGAVIGMNGIEKIAIVRRETLDIPGTLALTAAFISIIVKETMFWYTRAAGKKINSGALMADAWHHRSDALSSIGSLVGIAGARLGFPVLDPLASVVICIFIIKVAVDIFRDSINKLTDKACDKVTVDEVRSIILNQDGVLGIDDLKTRQFGDKIYIDVEILADGSMNLNAAHDIAENVHHKIENGIKNVKHCMVHVNPKDTAQEVGK
ncbi:MAG: cation diffusion facilitator family transporter [Firmicutes bacterium]|nr:cation diffusion facilitator family transporter [Bacillota bacterium]